MSELEEYCAGLTGPEGELVRGLIDHARGWVPGTEDGVSYGMPALRLAGKPLLAIQVTPRHIGLYPFSPAAIEAVAESLDGFDRSKGTIRFSAAHPLPLPVLEALLDARRQEIQG